MNRFFFFYFVASETSSLCCVFELLVALFMSVKSIPTNFEKQRMTEPTHLSRTAVLFSLAVILSHGFTICALPQKEVSSPGGSPCTASSREAFSSQLLPVQSLGALSAVSYLGNNDSSVLAECRVVSNS